MTLKYASVCAGIEAATFAWHSLGWEPVWFSEIDRFCCRLLAYHYPTVTLYGDFTALRTSGADLNVDLLVGGTPCQSYSVAGLRGGLSDERGNLTLEFVRLADAIDDVRAEDGKDPVCVVWENVPGVFSDSGNAFGCYLAGLAGCDEAVTPGPRPEIGRSSKFWRWCEKTSKHIPSWPSAGCITGPKRTVAWRVLDAQWFGLAQRRKRVFVVASAGGWADPLKILFEQEGMRRDSAPSREAGPSASALTASSFGTSGADVKSAQAMHLVAGTVEASFSRARGAGQNPGLLVPANVKANSEEINGRKSGGVHMQKCYGGGNSKELKVATTLTAKGQRIDYDVETFVAFNSREDPVSGELPGALSSSSPQAPAVAFSGRSRGDDGRGYARAPQVTGDIIGALDTVKPWRVYQSTTGVRRLTPTECERLQGFTDGYTKVDGAKDGPRYKAVGNSMASNVMHWLGKRIDKCWKAKFKKEQ